MYTSEDSLKLKIPGTDRYIIPGCHVRLSRFSNVVWLVGHGWYSWGGNRPTCGWFLVNTQAQNVIKPLQMTDLDDIYLIET